MYTSYSTLQRKQLTKQVYTDIRKIQGCHYGMETRNYGS